MGVPVYYLLKHNSNDDRNPRTIFDWLGISPKPLMTNTPVESGHNTIFYIQWGFSRGFDDIASVSRILTDYPQVTGTSTIYILALSISDNANKHTENCVQVNRRTEDNITFIDIHCSYEGVIYSCKRNNLTKTFLHSNLGIVEEKNDQNQGRNVVKKGKTSKKTLKFWLTACILISVGVLTYIYSGGRYITYTIGNKHREIEYNSCTAYLSPLLFLVLPALIVYTFAVSIQVSIKTFREKIPKRCRYCLLPWAFPLLFICSILVSIGVSMIICSLGICCKIPAQTVAIKETIYQNTNTFWKCLCCINSPNHESRQRILNKDVS